MYVYLPVSVVLFISGVVLAFFLVLHYVLAFLLAFNGSMDVAVEPRLTYYVNFVLLLPLGFGIAFQLPLVMLFLQRIGLFRDPGLHRKLESRRAGNLRALDVADASRCDQHDCAGDSVGVPVRLGNLDVQIHPARTRHGQRSL